MEDKDLQVENGSYTRIVNKVLDELVKAPILGAELAACLFVIRKTYGYGKKEDQISLSQFEEGIGRSRPTVTKALKNMQLVNILKLVKGGDSRKQSNVWAFNKYYQTWKLVKTPKLVKDTTRTSKEKLNKLVKVGLHTKDNTKEKTKERGGESAHAHAPKDQTRDFFDGVLDLVEKKDTPRAQRMQEFLREVSQTNQVSKDVIWREVKSFCQYWTELNQTGTREKWEMQKTFQVKLRLATWFRKVGHDNFSAMRASQSKGREIISSTAKS